FGPTPVGYQISKRSQFLMVLQKEPLRPQPDVKHRDSLPRPARGPHSSWIPGELPILGGSKEKQRLRDLAPESGLVSAEAFKHTIVKIGQPQKTGRQLPRIGS